MDAMISKLIHLFIMPCREVGALLEKEQSQEALTALQRLRLKAHLALCKACALYKRKAAFLDKAMQQVLHKKSQEVVSEEELCSLKEELKKKLSK